MNKSSRFVPSIRLVQYDVVNKQDEDMGQIQTFIIDMNEGLVAFALVAFGGTLGISDKWFALPWEALKWRQDDMKFVIDMPAEILRDAPGMDKDHWLEEIEKWQKDEDMADIDRYFTRHGYQSYLGVVQSVNVKRARRVVDAKFEINKDVAGEFRFKLIATNGEIIAVSEGYTAKAGVLNGIESVRNNAPDALIDDKTA